MALPTDGSPLDTGLQALDGEDRLVQQGQGGVSGLEGTYYGVGGLGWVERMIGVRRPDVLGALEDNWGLGAEG